MPVSCDLLARCLDPAGALHCLAQGGILLFPTETFYALGCLISSPQALNEILRLKGRNHGKPLPLAAASLAQIAGYCDLSTFPQELAAFWPGPLTVLLPLKATVHLNSCLVNARGEVAVRVSSHPLVASLAQSSGTLLTVSSANVQGNPAASSLETLDPALLARLRALSLPWGVVRHDKEHPPKGGLPSTIVRMEEGRLVIVRKGALAVDRLEGAHVCSF